MDTILPQRVGPRSSWCVRLALVASVLAPWPAPLRERMETTDGTETHEHARDHDVSSARAADNLASMPAPATPGNATALAPAASGMPAAPDESLRAEIEARASHVRFTWRMIGATRAEIDELVKRRGGGGPAAGPGLDEAEIE